MLHVEPAFAGQRIDNFLARVLKGVPRGHIYRILRRGEVRVNRGRIRPDYRMQAGDVVRLPPVRTAAQPSLGVAPASLAEKLEAAVILEQDDLLVIDKPAGLAVHGGSGLSWGLIEALRAIRPQARHLELVHRLDRETSGCLIVTKSRPALKQFAAAFREGAVQKRYLALSIDHWKRSSETIVAPLSRFVSRGGERIVQVSEDGREASTRFEALEYYPGLTLVAVSPMTGRTHQIRVHAAYAGHALAGDRRYGDDRANRRLAAIGLKRLFLHAHQLQVTLPDREIAVTAPLAPELRRVLDCLESIA
jgi:23S rRNA pseudouridine955/2504/2580 synthase